MRVVVLGNSGSGKSTLARWLAAQAVGTAVLDLDTVAWLPGQVAVPRPPAEAAAMVRAFCQAQASWVVEGCYADLAAVALAQGPRLLFLDPGPEACRANCLARPWEPHKYPDPAAQQQRLGFLLDWAADYEHRDGPMSRSAHLACWERYEGMKAHVRTVPPLEAPSDRMRALATGRRVLFTGAPGAGKTTLLQHLRRPGITVTEDAARAEIRARRASGLPPRPSPLRFAAAVLRRERAQWAALPAGEDVLLDRGLPDALGLLADALPARADVLAAQAGRVGVDPCVFVLPPWRAIHRHDAERDQDFDAACAVHQRVLAWYGRCGLPLTEVPPGPLAERAAFVRSVLASGA